MQVVAGWLVAFRKDDGGFGAVEYTAATECDDEVALVFPDEPDAVFTFADVGFWTDFAVGDFDERVDVHDELLEDAAFFKGPGRDEDAAVAAEAEYFFAEFADASITETDRNRLGVIPEHGVLLIR